jgi:hypothetical protein
MLSAVINGIENFSPTRANWELCRRQLFVTTDDDDLEAKQIVLTQQRIAFAPQPASQGTDQQLICIDWRQVVQIKDEFDRINEHLASRDLLCNEMRKTIASVDNKVEANRTRLAELQKRLVQVEQNQAVEQRQREALQQLQSKPNHLLFFRTLLISLESLFVSCKAIAGGFVQLGGDTSASASARGAANMIRVYWHAI